MLYDVCIDRAVVVAARCLDFLDTTDVMPIGVDDSLSKKLVDLDLSHDSLPGIRPITWSASQSSQARAFSMKSRLPFHMRRHAKKCDGQRPPRNPSVYHGVLAAGGESA